MNTHRQATDSWVLVGKLLFALFSDKQRLGESGCQTITRDNLHRTNLGGAGELVMANLRL